MSDKSKIEWTDATWNPVTGCSKVSEGCRNCYAMTFAERWRGTPGHYFENGFDIQLRPNKLDEPMRWTRPRKIFVNSMSDLFHKDIPDDYIRQVFDVMAQTPQHTYQVLTKRPDRMRDFVNNYGPENLAPYPLPNVWLGTSVENQKAADERIHDLINTSAAKLFLSCEPLLGPLDLKPQLLYIDWVIVGGESGHKARPMHPEWARTLRDSCEAASVPFFFKQWGEWMPIGQETDNLQRSAIKKIMDYPVKNDAQWYAWGDGNLSYRIGKNMTGRTLDGRTWDEMPKAPDPTEST